MAVTGNGTYSNPWVVDNIEDLITYTGSNHADEYVEVKAILEKTKDTRIIPNKLYFLQDGTYVSAPNVANLSIYYENSLVFDFRDLGDNINWVIYSHQINFNGAKLRNIIVNSGNAITFNSSYCEAIYNGYFENLTIESDSSFMFSENVTRLIYNCLFTGVTSSTSPVFIFSAGSTFNKCAFDIEFSNSANFLRYLNSKIPVFENCKIKAKGTAGLYTYFVSGGANTSSSGYLCLRNSFVDGVCPSGTFSIANATGSGAAPSYNSILNMDFSNSNYVSVQLASGSTNNILLNSSKKGNATVSSRYTQVTDEQLKDISYLQSIGFPIIGE